MGPGGKKNFHLHIPFFLEPPVSLPQTPPMLLYTQADSLFFFDYIYYAHVYGGYVHTFNMLSLSLSNNF